MEPSTKGDPSAIMDLPLEVIQRVLIHCHPREVAEFSKTCRTANTLIHLPSDQYLWRQLYLAYPFDHPETVESDRVAAGVVEKGTADDEEGVDYRKRLIALVKTERAAAKDGYAEREGGEALQALGYLLNHLPVWPNSGDPELRSSYNAQWLELNLREESGLLSSDPSNPITTTQGPHNELEGTKARLRLCLFSSYKHNDEPGYLLTDEEDSFFTSKRNRSRCFVYDLRNYSEKNCWGPFTIDNRVNWIHIEHLMNVVWMNLCDSPLTRMPRPKIGVESFRPHSSGGTYLVEDWAGVEGIWSRYVCFMDYRDLFSFNYQNEEGSIDPSFFEDRSFREATRLLEVKLELVDSSILDGLSFNPPRASQRNTQHPPLYFKGTSRGSDSGTTLSLIKGCVYEGEDGSVRWRFVRESIYDNTPQWSSSGVQIGDIGSAVGVIGIWTTTLHDQGDPVGPFWLFKNEDNARTPVMDYN